MPLYFAYGANLDGNGMAHRCPGSRALGLASLEAHRFFIMAEGYGSVRPERDAAVYGLLWDLAPADIPALDAFEEVGSGLYIRSLVTVQDGTGAAEALVYRGRTESVGVPCPGYMEAVVEAAEAVGLPDAYRAELRRWLPSASDA